MPFDPSLPAAGAKLQSQVVRDQLNALKALIDDLAAQLAGANSAIATLQSQLGSAVAGTSSNSNGVGTLGLSIGNNPPQQWEVQPIADKMDELINALRR